MCDRFSSLVVQAEQKRGEPAIDGGQRNRFNAVNHVGQASREALEDVPPESGRLLQQQFEFRLRNGQRPDLRLGYGFRRVVLVTEQAGGGQ